MTTKLIPAKRHRTELSVLKSRFITTIEPAFSVEEARTFIAEIKSEYLDASHNVPAFLIGHGLSTIEHCSDDGEPSGTAGKPMLAVLKGSALGDAAAVVTRYFGGTKLGKGGLVRAYGDALRHALDSLPRAQKVATTTLEFSIPYSLFEQTRRLITAHHGATVLEEFATDVRMQARFAVSSIIQFQDGLQELTNGRVTAIHIESNSQTILPLRKP